MRLIDADALLEAIEEYADRLQMVNWKENPNVPYKVHSLNWCINTIRDFPSAQSETAKRIVGKSRDGMTLWYQCDMCNEPVDAQDNFCCGCGRRLTDG